MPKAYNPVPPKVRILHRCSLRNTLRRLCRSLNPDSSGLVVVILERRWTFVLVPVPSRCRHLLHSRLILLLPSQLPPSLTHLQSFRVQSKVKVTTVCDIQLHPICSYIATYGIIIIIIKNVLIIVMLHTKVLQGHFTQINAKTLQMLRNNHMTARTVTSLEAAGRSEETVHL